MIRFWGDLVAKSLLVVPFLRMLNIDLKIQAGMAVAQGLANRGVMGRFATDFVSIPREGGGFDHYAIEVNLRKGGTTHPFLTLRFLTDGAYDPTTGEFYAQDEASEMLLCIRHLTIIKIQRSIDR